MTKDAAIKILEQLDGVTINGWGDRVYVNLRAAQKRFRGDQSNKLWLDADGTLHLDEGKGTTSNGFDDARNALIDTAIAAGIATDFESAVERRWYDRQADKRANS